MASHGKFSPRYVATAAQTRVSMKLSLLTNVAQVGVDHIFLDYDASRKRGDNDLAEFVVARPLVVGIRMIEDVLDGLRHIDPVRIGALYHFLNRLRRRITLQFCAH